MPVKRDRRLLVLRHLATVIPGGEPLDEFAVNNLLRPFSDDVASLRRLLVDEGLLERPAPGRYRKLSSQAEPVPAGKGTRCS